MSITVPETSSEQRTEAFTGRAEPGPGVPPGSLAGPTVALPRARHELVEQPVERLEAEVIAFVSMPMLDAERQPIDASPRRRNPTRRQRRVLDELHHECQQPGCRARAFLQYDHVHGGPTVTANLTSRQSVPTFVALSDRSGRIRSDH